ncbi:MAG: hypothetical protein JNM08_09300 [Rubrivivax sp.]|nr:hypothetical protein [Rubrivivax sp.]
MTEAPLSLPRRVQRGALLIVALALAIALGLGLRALDEDVEDELESALALGDLMARLHLLPSMDDEQALKALRDLTGHAAPRHLRLRVVDAQGRLLHQPPDPERPPWLEPWRRLHDRWGAASESRMVSWQLPRPQGEPWTMSVEASREAERNEALATLVGGLALVLLMGLSLLLAMHLNLARAFAPLQRLLQAIAHIERGEVQAVRSLPRMPVHELEAVAQALRHLGDALAEAESGRRALAQRVISLQEDERAHLARELHDEFGQHLTALRVDAAWLARRLADDPDALEVARAMAGHAQRIHEELRSVLARLRPLQGLDGDGQITVQALAGLLQSLVRGWTESPHQGPAVTLLWQGWLADEPQRPLPATLALTLYRITQEALSNAARHGEARQVTVALSGEPGPAIAWSVQDDGRGLADDPQASLRGSGLAGMKERVWALGSDLALAPAQPADGARPGLRLAARFELSPQGQ